MPIRPDTMDLGPYSPFVSVWERLYIHFQENENDILSSTFETDVDAKKWRRTMHLVRTALVSQKEDGYKYADLELSIPKEDPTKVLIKMKSVSRQPDFVSTILGGRINVE